MTSTTPLAELEIEASDVVTAWNALEPVVALCAETLGTRPTKADYHIGEPDNQGGVAGADLDDCLARVGSPASISVAYTAEGGPDTEPRSIELRIIRHRRFRELNVHLRVAGPADLQTLGLLERTEKALAHAITRFREP